MRPAVALLIVALEALALAPACASLLGRPAPVEAPPPEPEPEPEPLAPCFGGDWLDRPGLYKQPGWPFSALACVMEAAARKPPVVTVRVRPGACLAPCDSRLEARVPRHADNRALALVWPTGSSEIDLDGAEAAVLHARLMLGIPPGDWSVVALVADGWGRVRGRAETRILVGGGAD